MVVEFLRTSVLTTTDSTVDNSAYTKTIVSINTAGGTLFYGPLPPGAIDTNGLIGTNGTSINTNGAVTVMEKTMTVQSGTTRTTYTYNLSKWITGNAGGVDNGTSVQHKCYYETYLYYLYTKTWTNINNPDGYTITAEPVYYLNIVYDLFGGAEQTEAYKHIPVTNAYSITIPHSQKMNFQELWNPVVNEKWIFHKTGSTSSDFQLAATPV